MDYLLLLSSIVLGALSVFLFRLYEPRHVKVLNAFTGAYLLCLTMLHLLPELYHGPAGGTEHAEVRLGVLILAGFFTQVALDNSAKIGASPQAVKILERACDLLEEARNRLVLDLL